MAPINPVLLQLRRWNFIERARLERELWDAFEAGEDIDALLEDCLERSQADQDGGLEAFRLEVWQTTLQRIRKIEAVMKNKPKKEN